MEDTLKRIQHQLGALNVDVSAALTNQFNHMKTIRQINKLGINNLVLNSDLRTEIDKIERDIMFLRTEVNLLKDSSTLDVQDDVNFLKEEMNSVKEEMNSRWQLERDTLNNYVATLSESISNLESRIQRLESRFI